MSAIDTEIVDFSAALLLRYFRAGGPQDGDVPRLDHRRDLELLKAYWALSDPVRKLVKYVLERPHETQALLRSQIRVDNAIARGRIDARRTWLHRLQTGHPTAVVAHEPVRSFDTGPNLLLAWVLKEAGTYTARLTEWQISASPHESLIEQSQQDLRKVQRLEALRDPLRAVALGRKPATGAVREASRARRQIYRQAVEAYNVLRGLEINDPVAVNTVARSALFGPLEDWRRFELAVGLAVGEALGRTTGTDTQIHLLGSKSSDPIVTAGRFAVYWQQTTPFYESPPAEPSEERSRDALAAYDLAAGTERPDLVVVNRELGAVVSVIEVKYIAGDTVTGRFREAVDQVVRYTRAYAPHAELDALVSNCVVTLSRDAPAIVHDNGRAPLAIDFNGIKQNGLDAWAARLVA